MSKTKNCSDDFPSTEQFYADITSDVTVTVFLPICSVLAVTCIGIFVEELVFLQRIYDGNETTVTKLATILGLYPVTIIASLIPLLVPSSTILLDLLVSCYLSVCFYTFVTLIIDYFGGEEKMVELLASDMVRISTDPYCCCCCCILKPIKLTRKHLLFFKLCALQVAVIRPLLLFIAAVLWTDGKYKRELNGSTSYLYINIITLISTSFSLYGTIVIYIASRRHLQMYRLSLKYLSFKLLLVLLNIQNIVFSILTMFDLPECVGTRGPKIRGNYIHHAVLVIEAFLLTPLARHAYRRDESDIEGPEVDLESSCSTNHLIGSDIEGPEVDVESSGSTNHLISSDIDKPSDLDNSRDNPDPVE